jgi:hypothetical protein
MQIVTRKCLKAIVELFVTIVGWNSYGKVDISIHYVLALDREVFSISNFGLGD